MKRDPRVDDNIARAAPFAQPILTHWRELVHRTVPEVEEAIKWGMPHFVYKGKNLAGMAPFKAHCGIVIHGEGRQGDGDGMGAYGKVASLADLPPEEELVATLLTARDRIDRAGTALRRPPPGEGKPRRQPIPEPDDLIAALEAAPAARAFWDTLAPSHRWDYLDWITGAKQQATRARRLARTIEQLAEGKRQNGK